MDENGGSFVEVRRISQGPDRGSVYHSTPGMWQTASLTSLSFSVWENIEVDGHGLACHRWADALSK